MTISSKSPPLILASSSPYRKELLSRLGLPFTCHNPDIDESGRTGESPVDLVTRLAEEKARAVRKSHSDAVVIGSDQVAVLNGQILTKPGNHENAVKQLAGMSGQGVVFLTGLCVLDPHNIQTACITCEVVFRMLGMEEIERYLQLEQPYDCAGSFKSERLGISLFEKIECDDPTALIGLPLIRLSAMLRSAGLKVP